MPMHHCLRIFRSGRRYDISRQSVRRVVACSQLVSVGDRGAYFGLLEGMPGLLAEPMVCGVGPSALPGLPIGPLESPKIAVIVGDSSDLPFALAADRVDVLPDDQAVDAVITDEQLQHVLHYTSS